MYLCTHLFVTFTTLGINFQTATVHKYKCWLVTSHRNKSFTKTVFLYKKMNSSKTMLIYHLFEYFIWQLNRLVYYYKGGQCTGCVFLSPCMQPYRISTAKHSRNSHTISSHLQWKRKRIETSFDLGLTLQKKKSNWKSRGEKKTLENVDPTHKFCILFL